MIDVDERHEGDEVVCDECFGVLCAEHDGARGDEGNE
jgi:hypothetical protein